LPPPSPIAGLISVIMPSFNHAMFVAQAMKSVFEQSYRDVEFLIVDDCSTDPTFEIIQRMAANPQFKRRFRRLIISRNHTNLGAHNALNLGIEAAAGQYITFINSDDVYEPERLRLLLSHHDAADGRCRLPCIQRGEADRRSRKSGKEP